MKMKMKIKIVLAIGCLAITLFGGCGRNDGPMKKEVEILPAFSATLPSVLTGKASAPGGKAYIDGLNKNKMDAIVTVKNEDGFDINGWVFDDKTGTAPELLFVELAPVKGGDKYYTEAKRSDREDVARQFNKPELKKAGFLIKADLKSLPAGEYEINIIQVAKKNSILTATGGKINKVN